MVSKKYDWFPGQIELCNEKGCRSSNCVWGQAIGSARPGQGCNCSPESKEEAAVWYCRIARELRAALECEMLPKEKNLVDHPSHYNQGKIEVIDFIEDQNLGFHFGNAIKYVCRAGHKSSEVGDIKKAIWYLERYLEILGPTKEK